MVPDVSRLLLVLVWSMLLAGCASVESLTAEQVRAMSNAELCYVNSRHPVGFIPLEISHRTHDPKVRLNCENYYGEILDRLAQTEEKLLFGSVRIPTEMLNAQDCKGIRLGDVSGFVKGEGVTLGIAWESKTFGHYQDVHNDRDAVTYVLFNRVDGEGRLSTRFIKLAAKDKKLVRFGSKKYGETITIAGCYS